MSNGKERWLRDRHDGAEDGMTAPLTDDARRADQEEAFATFGLVLDLREEAARQGAKVYAAWLMIEGGEEGNKLGRAIYDHVEHAQKLLGVDDEARLPERIRREVEGE